MTENVNPVPMGQSGEKQPPNHAELLDLKKDVARWFDKDADVDGEQIRVAMRQRDQRDAASKDLRDDTCRTFELPIDADDETVRKAFKARETADVEKLATILHCRPEKLVADVQVLATILEKVATLTKVGGSDLVKKQGLVLALLEDPTVTKLLASNADLRARQARDEGKARRHAAIRNFWGFLSKSFWVAKWTIPALLVALVVGLCVQPMGVANLFAWLWGQATMEQRVQGEVERFMLPTLRETWGEDIAPKTFGEAVRFVERYQGKPDELMADALAASKRHVPVTTPVSMSNLVSFPEIRADQKSEELDLAPIQRCKDLSKAAPELVSNLAKQLEGKEHGIVARMLRVQLEGERPSVDLAHKAVSYMSAVVDVLDKDYRLMRDHRVRAETSAAMSAEKAIQDSGRLYGLQTWIGRISDDSQMRVYDESWKAVSGAEFKARYMPTDSRMSPASLRDRMIDFCDSFESAAKDRLATMAAKARNWRVYDPWEKFLPDKALGQNAETSAADIMWRVWTQVPEQLRKGMLEGLKREPVEELVRKAFGR